MKNNHRAGSMEKPKRINKTVYFTGLFFLFTLLTLVLSNLFNLLRTAFTPVESMAKEEIVWPLPVEEIIKEHPLYPSYVENEKKIRRLLTELKKPAENFTENTLKEIRDSLAAQEKIIRQYTRNFSRAEKKFMESQWDLYTLEGQKEYRRRLDEINKEMSVRLQSTLTKVKEDHADRINEDLTKLDAAYGALILQINLNISLCAASEDLRHQLTLEKERLTREWFNKRRELENILQSEMEMDIRHYAAEYQNSLEGEKKNLLDEINNMLSSENQQSIKKSLILIEEQNNLVEKLEQKRRHVALKDSYDNSWQKQVILTLRKRQAEIYQHMIDDIEKELKKDGYRKLKRYNN